ncbi:MAG: radical SAM protein [Acidobacteriota bacterium]
MRHYRPTHLYVEESVSRSPITRNVLERLPQLAVEVIATTESLLKESREYNPTIPRAKQSLVLARHKGRFFKPCPGGQARGNARNVCCNYFVINYAANCHMECSYCYLQSYLNFPYLIIHANLDDLLGELAETLAPHPGKFFRIGTGELADSLALDPLTGYSVPLVEFFSSRKNAVLEFKTKSDCVDRLLDLDHRGRTVVSWSMNPPGLQAQEEHKTATIEERLVAAQRCVQAGYPVAFHFDPLIFHPGWRENYQALVNEIFDRIPAASISWMSLGALRLTPGLKAMMRERFSSSSLPLAELVPSPDGKLRYVKPIRVEMYNRVLNWIRARKSPHTAVYACMERPEVWSRVFRHSCPTDEEVGDRLGAALVSLDPS